MRIAGDPGQLIRRLALPSKWPYQSLFTEVAQIARARVSRAIPVVSEITTRDHPKRADGCERSRFRVTQGDSRSRSWTISGSCPRGKFSSRVNTSRGSRSRSGHHPWPSSSRVRNETPIITTSQHHNDVALHECSCELKRHRRISEGRRHAGRSPYARAAFSAASTRRSLNGTRRIRTPVAS